jgi:hypothetical protein
MEENQVQKVGYGYCLCGCGTPTKISDRTRPKLGHVKGKHLKYALGHSGFLSGNRSRFRLVEVKSEGKSGGNL